jgi:hypothetical protein
LSSAGGIGRGRRHTGYRIRLPVGFGSLIRLGERGKERILSQKLRRGEGLWTGEREKERKFPLSLYLTLYRAGLSFSEIARERFHSFSFIP